MAAKTWDGGGADELWSTPGNWSGDAVPVTTDVCTFDVTSSKACTIDALGTFTGTISVQATYASVITQNVAWSTSGSSTICNSGSSWIMNASITGSSATLSVTGTGVFTRTTGTVAGGIPVGASATVNLGTDPTIGNITTNSGSTVTADGIVTFTNGTTALPNGTLWDTSAVTRLNMSSTFQHMNQGTSEGSFSGVPIYITGSNTTAFTGGNFDWNVVSVIKSGSGSITINASADVDFGANPTIVSNGMTVNGEMIASGTVVFDQLSTASPVAWSVGSGGIASGGFTNITLRGSLTINAAATWPANVILHIDPDQNVTATIDASGRTFGTCTIAGSTAVALTIAASTSITLAANSTAGFTGVVTVTGTLNLLGDLTLGGAMTTSASSTLSGTGVITVTEGTFTMNATCTVSNTIGVNMKFTGATGRSFVGAGKTYASFRRSGSGSGTLTITGTNTFVGAFSDNDGLVAHTIIFPNVTTTVGDFFVKGSSGKNVTMTRTGGAGTFTLSTTGGIVNQVGFITVSNSTVNASPAWYAGLTPPSVNSGGNTNWNFTPAPNAQMFKQQTQIIM